jgi:uncharacterized coiled-coil DUF342 family protein
MESIKKKVKLNTHIDEIFDYVDEKFNDVKLLVNDVDTKYQQILNKFDGLQTNISTINDKLTEDTIDRLNSLGTYEDFIQGFYDGITE